MLDPPIMPPLLLKKWEDAVEIESSELEVDGLMVDSCPESSLFRLVTMEASSSSSSSSSSREMGIFDDEVGFVIEVGRFLGLLLLPL